MRRTFGALAVALGFAAVVAVLAGGDSAGLAVVIAVLGFIAAVAIAAVLLLPAIVARALGHRRPVRPPARLAAAALVAGGLVVFPVYSNFYSDAEAAAAGGGMGYCGGILPLAQVVVHRFADEPIGEIYYTASCDD